MLEELVHDPGHPFALLQRVDRALVLHAPRIYGGPIEIRYAPLTPTPAPSYRAHLAQFFGRATVARADVLVEKRKFAEYIETRLRLVRFDTAEDAIAAFRLGNVYRLPPARAMTSAFRSEAPLEQEAVARVYFRVLRARLDEILRRSPNATQLRFLLETPLQFAHLPPAPSRRRLDRIATYLDPSTFDDIRAIQRRVLSVGGRSLTSLNQWKELVLFQARPEYPYEKIKAAGVERLLGHAVALGDARGDRHLNWLRLVHFDLAREAQTLRPQDFPKTLQLLQLLEMTPERRRSEAALERQAVYILGLTPSLRLKERRRIHSRTTTLERRLIQMYRLFDDDGDDDDPARVERAITALRRGLLDFLAERARNDQTFVVDREHLERLLPVAHESGFEVVVFREGEARAEIAITGGNSVFR